MSHLIQHATSSFPVSRSIPKTGSFLENSWVATEVLSFLCLHTEDLCLHTEELEIATRVCKAWKTHSVNALKTQVRSSGKSTPEDLIKYSEMCHRYHGHMEIATLKCSRLHSFSIALPVMNFGEEPNDPHRGRIKNAIGEIPLFFQHHAAQLRTLHCTFFEVPNDLGDWFHGFANLTRLRMCSGYLIEEAERETLLQAILSLGRSCPMLTHLEWDHSHSPDAQHLVRHILTAIPSLTSLSLLNFSSFPEAEIQAIADSSVTRLSLEFVICNPLVFSKYLKKITHLNLGFCIWAKRQPERSETLKHLLQACRELKFLRFGYRDTPFHLDDSALYVISTSCPQLLSLDLRLHKDDIFPDDLSFQEGYVPIVVACSQLRSLNLTNRMITDEELAALRSCRPALNIIHSKSSIKKE